MPECQYGKLDHMYSIQTHTWINKMIIKDERVNSKELNMH
jgi:hypothetical protein